MTTAVPGPGATPTRRTLVALAVVLVLIPAVLTALLVASAGRHQPDHESRHGLDGVNPAFRKDL